MGAKQSQEMTLAKKLITVDGLSAYAAAKKAGISKQAIYMSTWYQLWRGSKNDVPR